LKYQQKRFHTKIIVEKYCILLLTKKKCEIDKKYLASWLR
jgi:hypothetical protein